MSENIALTERAIRRLVARAQADIPDADGGSSDHALEQ
jgi:hypothetical protein